MKTIDSGGYTYSFGNYLKDILKKQTKDNELLSQDYFRKFLYNDKILFNNQNTNLKKVDRN